MSLRRCHWVNADPLYIAYHDEEWGVPTGDETRLFEMLILEGMQAGLSWYTILRKREAFRRAFCGFDPERIARFGAREVAALLHEPGIVRNRLKIEAAIGNARALLQLRERQGSLTPWLWSFVDGRPRQNHWRSAAEVPAVTAESRAMSRELKRQGFRFVGPTVCYAFMQAVGLVNDHQVDCFRHREVAKLDHGS